MMKKNKILTIVCACFLMGNMAVWAQTNPCVNPPRNLKGVYENNVTQLTWMAPEGQPDWLTWSNGVYDAGVGLGAGATPTMVHVFEPADLAGYGTRLVRIDFMVVTDTTTANEYGVYVYQPDNEDKLQIIAGQEVPNKDIKVGEWTEVVLTEPGIIDPTKRLYVGYNCRQLQNEVYPFAVDNGATVDAKGNLYNSNGWATLSQSGIPGNWLIRAQVEEAQDAATTQTLKSVRTERTDLLKVWNVTSAVALSDDASQLQAARAAWTVPALKTDENGKFVPAPVERLKPRAKNLRSGETPEYPYYNVYCNGELLGSTTQTRASYGICNSTKATYTYEVEYVASAECTSARTSVQVEAQSEAVIPQLSAGWAEHPNEPENLYYILASVNPVSCATGYVLYQRSKTYGESRYELGLNDYGIPYTGIYASVIPGDSTWISMAALYDFGNGVVESARTDSIPFYATCLGGAPVIDTDPQASFATGKDVQITFSRETLTHYVERDGEVVATTIPTLSSAFDRVPHDGHTYTYRIGAACGDDGEIAWSEPWTVAIPTCDVAVEQDTTFHADYEGQGFYWTYNYWNITEPGTYRDTLRTVQGCDSILTLHVTIRKAWPATVVFYGHSEAWASQVSVDYAHWEDNQWKLLNDEELSYVSSYGSECNLEQYYEFNVQMHPAAHRKVDNDSIIGFRLRSQFEEGVYTEWLPLPGYGEKLWYTASNLPGAKMFAVDADDTDHHLYYASLEGLSGDGLHDELNRILNEQKQVVDYYDLPTVYTVTDWWEERDPETGYVLESGIWDMYSGYRTRWGEPADNYGTAEAQATLNREHALPKSWWGHDNSNPLDAYSDVVHVIPTNTVVNAMRGAYPYSEVASPTQTSENGSKLGDSSYPGYSLKAFEPVDEYKGDLARIYFYMATCYAGLDFTVSRYADAGGVVFTYENGTTGFTDFGRTLFMDWAAQDPVSSKEIIRNNGIYSVQGNRNPFVDLPGLEQYLWGDKRHCLYYIDGSGECVEAPCEDLTFSAPFNGSLDGFTAVDKLGYQNWYNPSRADYINMNGYASGKSNPNEDWLVSPVFDLSGMESAVLSFQHVINYCSDAGRLVNNHTLWITSAYTGDPATTQWTQLAIGTMPAGTNWTWVTPVIQIPDTYLTDNVRFAFKYLSDDQMAGQWEIKNLTFNAVCEQGTTVGMDETVRSVAPRFYVSGRTVHVYDMPAGTSVSLYDMIGRHLDTRTSQETYTELSVPAPGMYVLTVGGKAYKLSVR